jgi:hypothetical protein
MVDSSDEQSDLQQFRNRWLHEFYYDPTSSHVIGGQNANEADIIDIDEREDIENDTTVTNNINAHIEEDADVNARTGALGGPPKEDEFIPSELENPDTNERRTVHQPQDDFDQAKASEPSDEGEGGMRNCSSEQSSKGISTP